MSHLLVDIGNTCAKLAQWDDGQLTLLADDWPLDAPELPRTAAMPQKIWVANVRRACSLADIPALALDVPVQQVDWSMCAPYLRSCYNTEQLGIDRVLAMLAVNAQRTMNKPALVIDIGTAMTIDVLDAEGVHQGGYILAGPELSIKALTQQTGLLTAADSHREQLPCTTEAAIACGAGLAIQGAIEQVRGAWPEADVYLGGGGYAALRDSLSLLHQSVSHQVIPQLVLAGLAELAAIANKEKS